MSKTLHNSKNDTVFGRNLRLNKKNKILTGKKYQKLKTVIRSMIQTVQ